jgi:hypothetical protein
MPKYQITGDEIKLGKGPNGTPSSDPRSGQFQLIGDNTSMSKKSIQSPSANPPSGQFQIVGDETRMARTPVKGWGNAANLTMSHRAIEQSKTAASGGRKKK